MHWFFDHLYLPPCYYLFVSNFRARGAAAANLRAVFFMATKEHCLSSVIPEAIMPSAWHILTLLIKCSDTSVKILEKILVKKIWIHLVLLFWTKLLKSNISSVFTFLEKDTTSF